MSSFEKTIKNACKPKPAPPKSKYLDPIITATYSQDGAVPDICRALSSRLREPNSVVVFKALIVLHHMIRSGSTDNVLSYLSGQGSQDILRLRNVVGQTWDGYAPPKNLACYAQYLDSRIRGYRDLKHDPVRAQAENNRMSNYEGASGRARKMAQLSVDKGLLREVRAVTRMVDALVQVRFFDDDLEDACTVMALKMLVKDLLVLTQAINEGVVNLLEHYFEMAKTDAEEALSIYKTFCKQTDKVVDYLNIARSLNSKLDVPVPHLKHAPVSLVKALEEYLDDPNFESNRLEYRQNMGAADVTPSGPTTGGASTAARKSPAPQSSAAATKPAAAATSSSAAAPAAQTTVNRTIEDFFSSIEQEQKAQPQGQPANFMAPFVQHPMANPFRQSMMMMPPSQMTGMPMAPMMTGQMAFPGGPSQMMGGASGGPGGMPMQMQMTGQPTMTGAPSPFGWAAGGASSTTTGSVSSIQSSRQQPNGFIQPQSTGFSAPSPFLQPNMTGQPFGGAAAMQPQLTGQQNPFRQSMMFPQSTGSAQGAPNFSTGAMLPQRTGANNFGSTSPFGQANGGANSSAAKPLVPQPTGSKNPFALPGDAERQKQRQAAASQPTLWELSQLSISGQPVQQQQQQQQNGLQSSQQNAQPSTTSADNDFMSSLASTFASGSDTKAKGGLSSSSDFNDLFGSNFGSSNQNGFSTSNAGLSSAQGMAGLNGQPTGSSPFNTLNTSAPFSQGTASSSGGGGGGGGGTEFLQPQPTGFAGSTVKPFKPSSNFGSSLVDSLPSLPSSSSSPAPGAGQASTSFSSPGLQPQRTGFNPFNMSTTMQPNATGSQPQSSGMSAFGTGNSPWSMAPNQTGASSSTSSAFGGNQPFGGSAFAGGQVSGSGAGANPFPFRM